MTDGGTQPHGPDTRERVLVETHVTAVGRGSRGPLLVTLLVIAAFAAGLLRPWDLLGPTPDAGVSPAASMGSAASVASVTPPPTPRAGTALSMCGYPGTWRTMSRVWWSTRQATVWTGVEVVPATGPADIAIQFAPVGPAPVMAIGWCAPVGDAGRPPSDATVSLYRLANDGAVAAMTDMGPKVTDVMGHLWMTGGSLPSPWPGGRYVIRFATPNGAWVRYMGLDVEDVEETPHPSGTPSY